MQRPDTKVPWKLLLSKAPVWALILSHFCHNWGTFILLTWMPTYYNQVLGLDLLKSGFYSVLPWITMAIAANIGGWVADFMVAKGVSITRVRKVMQTVSLLVSRPFLPCRCAVLAPLCLAYGMGGWLCWLCNGSASQRQMQMVGLRAALLWCCCASCSLQASSLIWAL